MGIRSLRNTKDRLVGSAPIQGGSASTQGPQSEPRGPLRFFTEHPTKPRWVDLSILATGQSSRPFYGGGRWMGSYQGRPELLEEIGPALRDQLLPLAPKSVDAFVHSLRSWWRLFDTVEAELPESPRLVSTSQLTEVHRQRALDQGMERRTFNNFVRISNTTRAALGLRPLYWTSPSDPEVTRHLPPQWQVDKIRHALKHRWFAAVDRWNLADRLRHEPESSVQPTIELERLRQNYLHFDSVVRRSGNPRPPLFEICMGVSKSLLYERGLSVADMIRGTYPDGDDIRAAFHLCLATTGWNPSVLLSLDATKKIVEPHPKDPSRYIIRGTKARSGGTEQVAEGLIKSQGGAGAVIQSILERVAPLRAGLQAELHACLQKVSELDPADSEPAATKLRKRVNVLRQATRSVWLYVSVNQLDIGWLSDTSSSRSVAKLTSSYVGDVVAVLNEGMPSDRQITPIRASDFRDAYASRVLTASGGSILSVMRALGHRSVRTTAGYLNNTLLKEEHRRLFSTFSKALWDDMLSAGRLDPTVLAKLSRDGVVSTDEHTRLKGYRKLMVSRLGIGCRDPTNPPRRIAPDFVSDGRALCHVQRCILCVENAVLLPESLPGLCMRLVELRLLQQQMSISAFVASSFGEELQNIELGLLAFDSVEADQLTSLWQQRFAAGTHRPVEFDGSYGGS